VEPPTCPSCSRPFPAGGTVCAECSPTYVPQVHNEQPTLEKGAVLEERFEVHERLGRGAYAEVYRGQDRLLARPVAIKAVRRALLAAGDARVAERFLREARLVARLEHPSVVQVYDAGDHRGTPWMAMQLVTGGSLAEVALKDGALAPHLAARVVAQAADALDYAHARGIIHRDLKPANILVAGKRPDGTIDVKITDFGIARVLGDPGETVEGDIVGTPAYMSPEQFEGSEVTARSDLFSLAAIAYELLVGRRPFTGQTLRELFYEVLNARYPPPSHAAGALPAALDQVFARALAADPRERYATAAEFALALEQHCVLPADTLRGRGGEIAGYEILAEAGHSLIGRVLKARSPDGSTVALKVAEDARGREVLKREVRMLSRLDHPAVARLIDSGETAASTFVVREWFDDAKRLPEFLAERRLALDQALEIVARVASVLDHAHQRGVLHLDLRPNSVLVRPDGSIVLGGFDRALEIGAAPEADLLFLGTPAYLSPEQIRQETTLGPAADLYALGVFLFELVSGRVPFVESSPYLTAMRHLTEPAPRLDTVAPAAPSELADLVARLLEKAPRDRPASAAKVSDRLAEIVRALRAPGATRHGGAPASVSYLERRLVAVAILDLVGFAEMAERSAPERVAFLLERWRALVERATSEKKGYITACAGDSMAVVFEAAPEEPDPGARVLGMLAGLARMVEEVNRTLDWRIEFSGGMSQGEALVGHILTGGDSGPTLIGATPIGAFKLGALARAGELFARESFARAHGADFHFDQVAETTLGGEPIYRLVLAAPAVRA
jgi:serine/threonine-protein kinase